MRPTVLEIGDAYTTPRRVRNRTGSQVKPELSELKQMNDEQYNRVAVALLEAPWARKAPAEQNGFDVSRFR